MKVRLIKRFFVSDADSRRNIRSEVSQSAERPAPHGDPSRASPSNGSTSRSLATENLGTRRPRGTALRPRPHTAYAIPDNFSFVSLQRGDSVTTLDFIREFSDKADRGRWPTPTYIDTGFDYAQWLRANPKLATLPADVIGTEVAIIGAGVSGWAAAHELHKIGLKPVIFERTDRIGGRLETRHFHDEQGRPVAAYADMGAMRFPLSGQVFWHYAKTFRLSPQGRSPLAGTSRTKLYFDGSVTDYPDEARFGQIKHEWESFLTNLLKDVRKAEAANNEKAREKAWQALVRRFEDKTYLEVLSEVTCLPPLHPAPKGTEDAARKPWRAHLLERHGAKKRSKYWGDEETTLFGVMGSGLGGAAPFFRNSFIDSLRGKANYMHDDLFSLPGGAESFVQAFCSNLVKSADGERKPLKDAVELNLQSEVSSIDEDPVTGNKALNIKDEMGRTTQRAFKAVLVTTTTPCMQAMHLGMASGSAEAKDQMLSDDVRRAMDSLGTSSASKLYIRTATKFWIDQPDLPMVLLGSQLLKSMYCMDQESTSNGVVCIDYAYGCDASKTSAWDAQTKFEKLREEIRRMDPTKNSWANRLADALEPMPGPDGKPEILSVNWQNETRSMSAFKATGPGQDRLLKTLANQFKSNAGVILCGDGTAWPTGWVEGNLHSVLNGFCAVVKHLGGEPAPGSPLSVKDLNRIDYSRKKRR